MSDGPTTPDPPAIPGGKGGECTTSDTRLVERAVRQRWPIPEDARPAIAAALADVARSRKASHRNRIAAARALTAMDALNMEQEKRDLQIPDRLHVTGGVQVIEVVLPPDEPQPAPGDDPA